MGVMYSFSHYVISFLYLLQILVAATLTGVSASDSTTVAVTVLGAINTVLAGILAWLNGQGMPQRYRRARDNFREVVKAIEASERMFAEIDFVEWSKGCRPTPIGERDRLEKMYEEARRDQEGNYPDTHANPTALQAQDRVQELEAKVNKHEEEKAALVEEMQGLREQLRSNPKDTTS